MSALHDTGTTRTSRTSATSRKRASLQPVPAPVAPLRHLPFMLVLAAMLGLGMLGLLLLNTSLQDQSFALSEKRAQATRLSYTEAELQQELAAVSSSRSLAAKATAQGMRPNPAPAFIVMPDGTVVGEPSKASGKEFGTALVKSQAQLAHERQVAAEADRKQREEAAARKKQQEEQAAAQRKAESEQKKQQEQEEGGR